VKSLFSMSLCVVLAACGGGEASQSPAKSPSPAVTALMLKSEPANAIGVGAAKQKGPADQVAVTGRIFTITPGFAQLQLMDLELPYCGEKDKSDTCPTPWDYCCDKPKIPANSLLVEARGADGKPLATASLGDLRLLDRVTVAGKLARDEHGNLALLATGWFRVERPTLADHVKLPQ
jgi:hypothetical protein